MRKGVSSRRLKIRLAEKIVDQHTFPEGVQLRPGRHAMNVARHLGLR
jgi:hypothetical protein